MRVLFIGDVFGTLGQKALEKYLPGLCRGDLIGAYGMSRFVDYSDHKTCTLFADGAGAVVLGKGPEPGFIASKIVAYAQGMSLLRAAAREFGWTLDPADAAAVWVTAGS